MSRKYSISGSDTNTAATTQMGLTSTAAIMPKIGFLSVGSAATPADNAWEFLLQRYTAAGTSTAVTPQALHPSDPAATASAGVNHSVEPTYTSGAILLRIAGNQRTPFVFYAMPGWEPHLPPAAANGVGLFSNAIGGSAVAMSYTIHYEE